MGLKTLFNTTIVVLALAMLPANEQRSVSADEYGTATFTAEQFVEYERTLNSVLRTRRDEEKKFIAEVVRQVRIGRIPSKLVSTSYGWIRNKRPTTNYPFIYFERVIRLQAERANLASEIPAFDFSIYSSPGQAAGRRSFSAGQRAPARRTFIPTAGQR